MTGEVGKMLATVLEKRDVLEGVAAPKPITSQGQLERYTTALLELERRDDLSATERDLAEILAALVEAFEEEHYPVPAASPVEVLSELMAANNLRQKDIAKVLDRPESTVSALLSGKRPFTREHIKKLSKRFAVSPAVFF
jgi:HTH-type transcriptional regulator/antitoxin HigA